LAEDGSDNNYGFWNTGHAQATVRGGALTGHGGTDAYGINSADDGTTLEAESVTALGEDGSNSNFGLSNSDGAAAMLRGGSFTARGGANTLGIYTTDEGTQLKTESVTSLAENGSGVNMGLYNTISATATLRDSSFSARGGGGTWGINNAVNATLEADNVTLVGKDGSGTNYALDNDSSEATLHACTLTAREGTDTYGIRNRGDSPALEGHNVTVLAENGSDENYGLGNSGTAELHGGSLTVRGGTYALGIYSTGEGTQLRAESVTALAENGSNANMGLFNSISATATLRDGSFSAHGGEGTWGINNTVSASLEADNVTALGKDGSGTNYGLDNDSSEATLHACTLTARGGTDTYGIRSRGDSPALEGHNTTVLAEDGSSQNLGLVNSGTAALHSSSFTSRGGAIASGIINQDDGTLEADNITAVGKDGDSGNWGLSTNFTTADITNSVLEGSGNALLQVGGTVRLGASQLDGGALRTDGGILTCCGVYDGNFAAYTCP
jgi:hypothetical protein